MEFTETQLKMYAAPLSDTEDAQCQNAINMVRDALQDIGFEDDGNPLKRMYEDTYAYQRKLKSTARNREITIFIQGSYANNTNVRTESDVDIAVVQEEVFHTRYREGVTDANYNFSTVALPPITFKDEVQNALFDKFADDVERKNKSIKIHGNSYRKDADTVPSLRYRNYSEDYSNDVNNYFKGILIKADDGEIIINYPELHIYNGKKKNEDTQRRFKKMVRILKKIRYLMKDNQIASALDVSSFGLESLFWNIPDDIYMKYISYGWIFDDLVLYLERNLSDIKNYKEANGIKKLCPNQETVNSYMNFVRDLKLFYQYKPNE